MKSPKINLVVLLIIILIPMVYWHATCVAAQMGQNALPLSKPPSRTAYVWSGVTSDGWGWTAEKWSGDNTPYAQLRSTIDLQTSGDADRYQIYLQRFKAASLSPSDPQAQFAYAYSAWKLQKTVNNLSEIYDELECALDDLVATPSPHTYDFVRLRFLIEASLHPSTKMLPLCLQLLRRDPTDFEVKYMLAATLMLSPSGTREKELALPVIAQLIAAEPSNPEPYYLRGMVYIDSCNKNNNTYTKPDVDAAESALNEYLKLTPSNDYWKPAVQQVVDGLERVKANGYKIPDIPQHDSDK